MSANMTVDSSSSSDDNQNNDSASSSYANVVLNLKTPREDKNDNNKENIEKDGNQINNPAKILTDSVQSPSTITTEPIICSKIDDNGNNTITEQKVELPLNQEQVIPETEDDLSFIPVVSHHNRKERKLARRDPPSREKANGSSAAVTGTSASRPRRVRADRSANRGEKKGRRSKDQRIGDTSGRERDPVVVLNNIKDAKLVEQPSEKDSTATTTKSANEEDVESAPVKFVEAPIPKVNAWKVSFMFLLFILLLLHISVLSGFALLFKNIFFMNELFVVLSVFIIYLYSISFAH